MSFATETPFQENIRPGFVGDFLSREHVLAGGIKVDGSTFDGADAVRVEVTADAVATDDELAVVALPGPIASGSILRFGAGKYARLTAAAEEGDVTLAVEALAADIDDGDIAYHLAAGVTKRVAAGTLVGITAAVLEAADTPADGALWHAAQDADDYVRILAYDIPDVDDNNDADILRPGTLIYVNFLPAGWANVSATLKGKIRAAYDVSIATPGQEVEAS